MAELGESSVVEHLMLVVDDERHHTVPQTFAEQDEPAHTTVAVLEWVYALESPMKFG